MGPKRQKQHDMMKVCMQETASVMSAELLSATSSGAKATKTERHDESLHARNSICHVCGAQRCCSAVEPCLSTTSKTSTWPEVCVRAKTTRETKDDPMTAPLP